MRRDFFNPQQLDDVKTLSGPVKIRMLPCNKYSNSGSRCSQKGNAPYPVDGLGMDDYLFIYQIQVHQLLASFCRSGVSGRIYSVLPGSNPDIHESVHNLRGVSRGVASILD